MQLFWMSERYRSAALRRKKRAKEDEAGLKMIL